MSGSGNSGTDRDDAEPDGPQVADARAGEPADDTQAPAVEAGDGWLVGAWSAEGWKAAATAPPRAPEPPDGPTPADGPDGPALHSAASGDDVAADARPEASGPDTAGGLAADHRAAEDSGAEGSAARLTGVAGGGAAEDRAGGDRAADGDATGDTAADVSAAGDALSGNGGAGAGRADDGATGAGATGGSAVGDGVAEGGAARGGAAHGGAGDGSPAGGDAAGDTAADVSAADVSAPMSARPATVWPVGAWPVSARPTTVRLATARPTAPPTPAPATGRTTAPTSGPTSGPRADQHADTAGPGTDEPDAGPVATERAVLAEGPRVPSATATSPAPPLAPAARRTTAPADLRPAAPGPPPPPPPSPSTPPIRPQAAQPVAGARGARTAAAGAVGLSEDAILRARDERPEGGWRGLLYSASGGRLNPGIGPAERLRHEQLQRIRRALPGSHHVAIGSIKGGVGKTSVAAGLGLVLAESRGDRVIALDANPDAGTLADRLTGDTTRTVRDLLTGIGAVGSLADVAHYASLAGRLQVLASEQDPAMSAAFDRDDYERVCAVLTRFYDIVITDSGPGLVHSAMEGTLALADTLVIVGAPAADGVSRASKTLDWLVARGHAALVADALIVLSCDRSNKHIDTERVRSHFATRCRAVVEVPFDPHLATGARIELGRLRPATHEAFLELAAHVADGFPPHGARPVTASSRG